MGGAYATLQIHEGAMQRAADGGAIAAIDLAEYLVVKGTPFREAHAIVASLVRRALDEQLDLAALVAQSEHFGEDAVGLLEPGVAVTRRTTPGGAGPVPVASQAIRFAEALNTAHERG
jgi:argininosuccinate lyase